MSGTILSSPYVCPDICRHMQPVQCCGMSDSTYRTYASMNYVQLHAYNRRMGLGYYMHVQAER